MISASMAKAINKQINAETYSAYLYLSMSAFAANNGMPGAANWLLIQCKEEMTHSQRFYNYLLSQAQPLKLAAIAAPPTEFKSLLHVFEEVLKHERKVTALINNLADLAVKEKDHATSILLQWFIKEQVEEEESANAVLDMVKLTGKSGDGLFMIDRELATRVFTPPVDLP